MGVCWGDVDYYGGVVGYRRLRGDGDYEGIG